MPKFKQPNSSKVRSILYEYASEFTSTPKRELFCEFCDCLMKSDTRFVVEAHHRSTKHQGGSFHEIESRQTFLKDAIQDFAHKLLFISFQYNKTIGLFSNTVYEYALYSALQLKRRKLIDQNKIKIYKL